MQSTGSDATAWLEHCGCAAHQGDPRLSYQAGLRKIAVSVTPLEVQTRRHERISE